MARKCGVLDLTFTLKLEKVRKRLNHACNLNICCPIPTVMVTIQVALQRKLTHVLNASNSYTPKF